MADDVTIKFAADVSDLQRGMQQATSMVDTTTSALRNGAAQINASFVSLSQASANSVAQRAAAAQSAGDAEMDAEKQKETGRYKIALDGVKQQELLVNEEAQTAQISKQEELSNLLTLVSQREAIERQHVAVVQGAQESLEVQESKAAVRRLAIQRDINQQICADYKRTFDQIGASVSSSLMGMIEGHETFRQAAQKVALSIVQSFIQSRIRLVADWSAGIAAKNAITNVGEAAQTTAVATGTATRTSLEASAASAGAATTFASILKNISASAAETFAGIFGFLSPIMGPAAAGPAAAGEATVRAVMPSYAVGAWSLPSDQIAQVHQGEMIVPAGPAAALRSALSNGSGTTGTVNVQHSTNFNITTMDAQGVKSFLNANKAQLIRSINDGVRLGAHLGLSKLT